MGRIATALFISIIGFVGTAGADEFTLAHRHCIDQQRRQVDAGVHFLRHEIAMLEARLAVYEPTTRFGRGSALLVSYQETQLMLLDRRLQLAALRDYQRALGRSYAW